MDEIAFLASCFMFSCEVGSLTNNRGIFHVELCMPRAISAEVQVDFSCNKKDGQVPC